MPNSSSCCRNPCTASVVSTARWVAAGVAAENNTARARVSGRILLLSAMISVIVLLLPALGVAQSTAANRLAAARTALRGAQLDSAELLLREALDSGSAPSRGDRVEAWLLIGVARYYAGNDSGVAAAFREALALEPALAAPRLAQYDSSLVVLLEAQRHAPGGAVALSIPALRLRVDTIDAQVCVPACPRGVTRPRLRAFPVLDWNAAERDPSMALREARMVVRYVVDTAGRVDTMSIHVVTNNFPIGTYFQNYVAAYLSALAGARYEPARAGNQPVPVIVEDVLRFEVQRGWRVNGFPVGHHF